jgi:hypothetical protein
MKKILIIDDEKDVITYLDTLFKNNGYDTISADNADDGIEKAKTEKPDLRRRATQEHTRHRSHCGHGLRKRPTGIQEISEHEKTLPTPGWFRAEAHRQGRINKRGQGFDRLISAENRTQISDSPLTVEP